MNEQRHETKVEKRITILMLWIAGLALVLFSIWMAPRVATWALTGKMPALSFSHAATVLLQSILPFQHADKLWPPDMRAAAHQHARFWLTITLFVLIEIVAAIATLRQLDRVASRPVADRRWWQLRGIAPRTFGRTNTIAPLLIDRPKPDRIIVGTVLGRKVAVEKNNHMVVIAPARQGKTSGIIIPAVLEHRGPVISTSVRTDVRDETILRRRQLGNCYQWDPMNPDGNTDFYDPIHGCQDWEHALRVASWFIACVKLQGGSQDYFNEEAETLLAPYLYAAAWADGGDIKTVHDWLEAKDCIQPTTVLTHIAEAHPDVPDVREGALAAIRKLEGQFAYNERQLDGILGTARVFLKVYGRPSARRSSTPPESRERLITPEAIFGLDPETGEEQANTLYIVADRDDQKLLAPVIVMLLSEMLYYLDVQHNKGRTLPIAALMAWDEMGQIAPLDELPKIVAHALPNARLMTVWHGVSQIQERYGQEAAREILQNSHTKVFLGSNTDRETISELALLIGQPAGDTVFNTENVTAQALQRLRSTEGILVAGNYPPTVFKQRRWYKDPHLKALARPNLDRAPNQLTGATAQ